MQNLNSQYKRLKKLEKKNPGLFTRIAGLEIEMGKVRQAKLRLNNGLAQFPNNPTAHLLLAKVHILSKKQDAALQACEEALRLDPSNMRVRRTYVDLLHAMGRSSMELAAHTRMYELSPADEFISKQQQELLQDSMVDLFGEDYKWEPDWHLGDFTEIGGLSRAICTELNLMPSRTALPKQFSPTVDDSLVAQLSARLPSPDPEETTQEKEEVVEDQAEAEITDTAAEEVEPEVEAEADIDQPEDQPVAETAEESEDSEESTDQTPEEPEVDQAVVEEIDPDTEPEPEEASEVEIAAEEEAEGDVNGEEIASEEVERVPETELEKLLVSRGVDLEDIVDYEAVLAEMKQEVPDRVSKPDIKVNITAEDDQSEEPQVTEPEAGQSEAEETVSETTSDAATESEESEEAQPESQPDAVADSEADAETAVETEDESDSEQPQLDSTEDEIVVDSSSAPPDSADVNDLIASFKEGSLAPGKQDLQAGPEPSEESTEETGSPETDKPVKSPGSMSQEDLDALIAASKKKRDDAESQAALPRESDQADSPQSVENAGSQEADDNKPAAVEPEEKSSSESKPLNQTDLDDLLSSFKTGKTPQPAAPAEKNGDTTEVTEPERETEADATPETEVVNQESESTSEPTTAGTLNQSDLDELLASFKQVPKTEPSTSEADTESQLKPALEDVNELTDESSEADTDSPEGDQGSADDAGDIDQQDSTEEPEPEKPRQRREPRDLGRTVISNVPEVEDIDDLVGKFSSRRRAKPGSQVPVDMTKYDNQQEYESEAEPMDIVDNQQADSTESQPPLPTPESVSSEAEPDPQFVPYGPSIEKPEPVLEQDQTTEPQDTTNQSPAEQPAQPVVDEPEVAESAEPNPEPVASVLPATPTPQPASTPEPRTLKPVQPMKKRPVPVATKKDESSPDEYRGPVSKTLIKLQLGQGKVDHARAMLARLRQQSPNDPDLENIAEQIEAAAP